MTAAMIIADEDAASRERDMLARLQVGLAADGVRIIHAVPQTLPELVDERVFSAAVPYEPRGPLPPAGVRARDLLDRALRLTRENRLDVIHVFGRGAWRVAAEAAAMARTPVVVEVFSQALADALLGGRDGGLGRAPTLVALAPGVGLERRCAAGMGAGSVRLVRWGVHHEPQPHPGRLAGGDRPAFLLAGPGDDAGAWRGLLGALSRVRVGADAPPLVFVDAEAASRCGLGQTVRELGVVEHVGLVPCLEGRREPVLHVDALVLPDAAHEHRSLTLDALARGVLVAAMRDPIIDELGEGYGVCQLDRDKPSGWADTLDALVRDPTDARERRELAARATGESHTGSGQVAKVGELYESLASQRSG